MKLGSHVSVSGKGLLSAVKEAISYNADTFMIYTGAPQNTRRKNIEDMFIGEGLSLMKEYGIEDFIVHAPYIMNFASPNKETFQMSVDFLAKEIVRTEAMGAPYIVMHPGAHVGSGEEIGLQRIVEGLNEVITSKQRVKIALELMAGKGTELNYKFEHSAYIMDKVKYPDKLTVCFDTCHTHDAGYDIINDFDGVMDYFDRIIGIERLEVFHINGSLNQRGKRKDRHANIGADENNPKGKDYIGLKALKYIVHHEAALGKPCILETPWIDKKTNLYKEEIIMLK
ncbi:deoxyribonuclease IV [Alkaliphilus peptidifermentans]|uniref:Probable endonuclease 4 n=1 Tax=Alkaliphilus peptidifermentans DSM 18978 TaxID=1120976 RepID=A0A1G5GDW6_9FIRM|nr:deoxyribonuclease IV [Alkaliphilus peptidifermentans]SCY49517.1 Endonuclease IV [Alkaliphilus peptidifermentans DSM 18978]